MACSAIVVRSVSASRPGRPRRTAARVSAKAVVLISAIGLLLMFVKQLGASITAVPTWPHAAFESATALLVSITRLTRTHPSRVRGSQTLQILNLRLVVGGRTATTSRKKEMLGEAKPPRTAPPRNFYDSTGYAVPCHNVQRLLFQSLFVVRFCARRAQKRTTMRWGSCVLPQAELAHQQMTAKVVSIIALYLSGHG